MSSEDIRDAELRAAFEKIERADARREKREVIIHRAVGEYLASWLPGVTETDNGFVVPCQLGACRHQLKVKCETSRHVSVSNTCMSSGSCRAWDALRDRLDRVVAPLIRKLDAEDGED